MQRTQGHFTLFLIFVTTQQLTQSKNKSLKKNEYLQSCVGVMNHDIRSKQGEKKQNN